MHGRFRESDLLRHVFETVVARCIEEGLASGQRFAADASLIQADANRQNSSPQSEWEPDKINPEDAPRAVREYLDTLDDAAFGAASPVQPKFTSHSDPASQWTGARGGPAYFAYSANYLIDTDNAVILDIEATRSIRQAELGAVGCCWQGLLRQNLRKARYESCRGHGSIRVVSRTRRSDSCVVLMTRFERSR